jgi:undecaprenyl-diphosphatase
VSEWVQVVVLGLVQGVAEFLPISSSGHLVLVPHLAGWARPGLAFDVALHLGSAAAIVVSFRRDLLALARAAARPHRASAPQRRLVAALIVGCLPIAVAGLTLRDFFAEVFEAPSAAALFLFLTAALLVPGERVRARRIRSKASQLPVSPQPARRAPFDTGIDLSDPSGTTLGDLRLTQALLVGVGQSLALFHGLSRSGTTITAGLIAGMTRPAAARFSFLLALPAVLGAGILSIGDLADPGPYTTPQIALGVLASFGGGLAAIAILLRLVSRAPLTVFVAYLLAAGLGSFAGIQLR